jgi:hypothetical protein
MILKKTLYITLSLTVFVSCIHEIKRIDYSEEYPSIIPDYKNISIPYNIAPLNFLSGSERMQVELKSNKGSLVVKGKRKIFFPKKKFRNLLQNNIGDTIWITVNSYSSNKWLCYKPFFWRVEAEPIDSFLTYRLIEPGYAVFNKVAIAQRNVTDFTETYIADNNLTGNNCMNCHIPNKHKPSQSFLHIRGKRGMTVIADNGKLYGINTRLKGAYSSLIYGNWSPSGKYIAFSNNVVLPSTHSIHNERAFVYDTLSDVVVLNLGKNEVLRSDLLMKKDALETFPEFSADGTRLFYCSAKRVTLPDEYDKLHYSLCAVDFDEITGTYGIKADTLFNGPATQKTVSQPKASPDGQYLAFTCFGYGTFPLWHNDAKIYLYNLKTGNTDTLPELNNNTSYANSYHSWSTNSHWLAFASKRDNGLYSKVYFSYIDENGHAHKPFILPQKDPEYYDFLLKSYNVPELVKNEVPFDALDIEKLCRSGEPEMLHYRKQ